MNAMCAVRTSGSEEEEQALLPRIFPKGLLSLELLVDVVLIRIDFNNVKLPVHV